MKTSTARSCFFFALFPIIIVFLVLPVHAAEKKKFTLQTKPVANISKTTVYLEDKPKHVLTQDIELRTLISSNPDFNNLDVRNYGQSDSIAGTGSHRGYSFYYHKNGDKAFTKWEGTHKTTLKEDRFPNRWPLSVKRPFPLFNQTVFPEVNELQFMNDGKAILRDLFSKMNENKQQRKHQVKSMMQQYQTSWIYGWGNPVNSTDFGDAVPQIWNSFVHTMLQQQQFQESSSGGRKKEKKVN